MRQSQCLFECFEIDAGIVQNVQFLVQLFKDVHEFVAGGDAVFLLQRVEAVDALLHVLQTLGVDLDVVRFCRQRLSDVAQFY